MGENGPSQLVINTAVGELHRLKNEINKAIKNILTVQGLEVQMEVNETQDHVPWLEVSVMQEIYP